jgi:hypothetical protein
MCDLSERVNAGIGPPGAMKTDFLFGYFCQSPFDALLDGVGIGLDLPTAEAGAVVCDGEFEMHGGVRFLLNTPLRNEL